MIDCLQNNINATKKCHPNRWQMLFFYFNSTSLPFSK